MGLLLKNTYKFKNSCISREVNTFKELLNFVIYDYEVIEIEGLEGNEYYSEQEKRVIEAIMGYQKDLDADLELLRFTEYVECIIEKDYKEQLRTLSRKDKRNRGIYYIPTVDAYTSTTLYKEAMSERGRKDFSKYVTDIIEVVKKTMYIHNKTNIEFKYPYKLDNIRHEVTDITELYNEAQRVLGEGKDFQLVNERVYYSRETIRNINKLLKQKG